MTDRTPEQHADTVRDALNVSYDASLGEHRDASLMYESSLSAFAALDELRQQAERAEREANDEREKWKAECERVGAMYERELASQRQRAERAEAALLAVKRIATQDGNVTAFESADHLCNGKCPDEDDMAIRDPDCLPCVVMDFPALAGEPGAGE